MYYQSLLLFSYQRLLDISINELFVAIQRLLLFNVVVCVLTQTRHFSCAMPYQTGRLFSIAPAQTMTYMVKSFKNLHLKNQKAHDLGTRYVAKEMLGLPRLFK